jgi:tetratricopeptide (TPR) repeat protein
MAFDPYSSCPCGSGKKFKWCCQPIHVDIDRAFRQDQECQHEAALKIMAEVVAAHPANPEAWGRQAQLLFQNDRVEEAENALQRAFECNPDYPFGHFLRGMFRFHEGEIAGAAKLLRRAAEVYDPEARDMLAQVYGVLANCELKLNHPVAARAAFQIVLRYAPGDQETRQAFEQLFGKESRFPESARREYTFLSAAATLSGARRQLWDRALSEPAVVRLSDAARAFEELTRADEQDAAAWYNLGLARAWLGDNPPAVEALDRYLTLEPDEARAAAAWTLAEVLRSGHGMDAHSDYREHSTTFELRDPQPLFAMFQRWEQERRLVGVQANEEQGVLSGLILERAPVFTVGSAGGQMAALASYMILAQGILRVWFAKKESLDKVVAEIQQSAGQGLSPPHERTGPGSFADVLAEAVAFPTGPMPREEAARRVGEYASRFFEETWIHRPLKSLNMIPPIDAAGHLNLRKKLRGLVRFIEECATVGTSAGYDFSGLRRKLGILEPAATGAPAATPVPSAAPQAAAIDIGRMGAAELAGLSIDSMSDEQVEEAYHAAQKLDAKDLAGHFARGLIARPPRPERADRYPFYVYLSQRASEDGNGDAALDYVSAGESFDGEYNEGRRRNDYELRRARVHAKRGEAEQAGDVFDRLIAREPSNLRYRSDAAEAMLSARQGARALHFAEQGLAAARQQNNRDQEQYFLELAAAAKKLAESNV